MARGRTLAGAPFCGGGPAEAREVAPAGGLQREGAAPQALPSRQPRAHLESLGGTPTLQPRAPQQGLSPSSGRQRSDLVAAVGGPPPCCHALYNLAPGLARGERAPSPAPGCSGAG